MTPIVAEVKGLLNIPTVNAYELEARQMLMVIQKALDCLSFFAGTTGNLRSVKSWAEGFRRPMSVWYDYDDSFDGWRIRLPMPSERLQPRYEGSYDVETLIAPIALIKTRTTFRLIETTENPLISLWNRFCVTRDGKLWLEIYEVDWEGNLRSFDLKEFSRDFDRYPEEFVKLFRVAFKDVLRGLHGLAIREQKAALKRWEASTTSAKDTGDILDLFGTNSTQR